MREEDLKMLLQEPFKLEEGSEYFVVFSPDDSVQYLNHVHSSGYPMKVLELHSKDNERAVATVFSYKRGMRFMIVFNLQDMRSI